MKLALEDVLIEVWRQTLIEEVKKVELRGDLYPVSFADDGELRQVYFVHEGQEVRGLEQSPHATSTWAEMARAGKKVMQFLSANHYLATVADGKLYSVNPGDKHLA